MRNQQNTLSKSDKSLIDQIGRFARAIDREFGSDNCPFDMELAGNIERYRAAADHLRWSYPVDYSYLSIGPSNRLKTLFSGPLFISEKFPWPVNKKGEPLEPICQIDLADFFELDGLSLGNGLLQLWIEDNSSGHLLRLVPINEILLENLSPVPIAAVQFEWSNPRAVRLSGSKTNWTHGYMVTAVHKRVLTVPHSLVSGFDDIPAIPRPGLLKAFNAMKRVLDSSEVVTSGPSEIGYYGNFTTIQYDCIDCPDVLIAMAEAEGIFWWGDCGHAQLFYALNKNGSVDFTFDWCC